MDRIARDGIWAGCVGDGGVVCVAVGEEVGAGLGGHFGRLFGVFCGGGVKGVERGYALEEVCWHFDFLGEG